MVQRNKYLISIDIIIILITIMWLERLTQAVLWFQSITAVNNNIAFFWDMTPCNLVDS